MMTTTDDGGPAFPETEWGRAQDGAVCQQTVSGMTLRDYFAGQALMGLSPAYTELMYALPSNQLTHLANLMRNQGEAEFEEPVFCIARTCYEIADAMLVARKGGA